MIIAMILIAIAIPVCIVGLAIVGKITAEAIECRRIEKEIYGK